MNRCRVILSVIAIPWYSLCIALPSDSFHASRKIAAEIFHQNPVTLYCGCKYDSHNRIDLSSCRMSSASHHKRAHIMEWEHMMPAEHFGRQFRCWRIPVCQRRNGKMFRGRKCCQKVDAKYRKAEGELYNLWPSVGLINQMRSNYRLSMLNHKKTVYGCRMAINHLERKVEPPDRAKGILARANLFMSDHYHVHLSQAQRQLFTAWNHGYPPTKWERRWAKQVEKREGYSNPYIY